MLLVQKLDRDEIKKCSSIELFSLMNVGFFSCH